MKKRILKIIAAAAIALAACSCRGPMGPRGPKGDDGEGMNWEVLSMDCPANAWEKINNADGTYYYTAHFRVDALTELICNEGNVSCFVVYSDGVQANLPSIRFFSGSDEAGSFTWQTSTDFEFSPGNVDVYYTTSDFFYQPDEPGVKSFRLVLQW